MQKGLEWFENNKDLQTLVWSVHKDNTASRRLAEKNGFARDESLDFDETWIAYSRRKKSKVRK